DLQVSAAGKIGLRIVRRRMLGDDGLRRGRDAWCPEFKHGQPVRGGRRGQNADGDAAVRIGQEAVGMLGVAPQQRHVVVLGPRLVRGLMSAGRAWRKTFF
nr:hypothetical protein [Tanacetum cinerariifolium]